MKIRLVAFAASSVTAGFLIFYTKKRVQEWRDDRYFGDAYPSTWGSSADELAEKPQLEYGEV